MATKPKLLIATPCYGGMITVSYFKSLMKLNNALQSLGIEFHILTKSNESLITRGRNALVAEFIGRKQYTHLLWIDADMGFEPELIVKMLEIDQPVVGAACPMKNIDWERVKQQAPRAKDGAQLRSLAMQYNINLVDENDRRVEKSLEIRNGFLEVSTVGTGIMMIRRDVFDIMREKLPDAAYTNDIAGYDNEYTRGNFYTFFDTMLHPVSKRYLSEDYAFCYRWVFLCGGNIYLNIEHKIVHFGSYPFTGAFIDNL